MTFGDVIMLAFLVVSLLGVPLALLVIALADAGVLAW